MSSSCDLMGAEKKLKLHSVKFKNMEVWPVLHYYICAKHTALSEPKAVDLRLVFGLLSNLFFGLKNFFVRTNFLFVSSSDQRFLIKGTYKDKLVDYIADILPNALIIERPVGGHYKKKEVYSKYLSSKLSVDAVIWVVSKFVRVKKNLQNEDLIIELLKSINTEVDYYSIIKKHHAQYLVWKFLGKRKKWKAVFVVCSYTNMGMVKAFKTLNIPVVEVQHGLISQNHCAYYVEFTNDKSCYPDYLLTFGTREKAVFSKKNTFIDPGNVFPVGHFYLDYLSEDYKGDPKLKNIQKGFSKTVAISSQNHPIEKKLIAFIRSLAKLDPNTLFIFVPRTYNKTIKEYGFSENVILTDWLNVYEIIAHSDVHATVFSTCALEAPSLGVRNVLINLENKSIQMFDNILRDESINSYVNSPEEFLEVLYQKSILNKKEIKYRNKDIIVSDYKKNIKSVIHSVLGLK